MEQMDQNGNMSEQMAPEGSCVATLMAAGAVPPEAVELITELLTRDGMRFRSARRLGRAGTSSCVELHFSALGRPTDREALKGRFREKVRAMGDEGGFDVALQEESPHRRRRRLVAMDFDSTLIQNEIVDELARERGVFDEVAAITRRSMAGELGFDESLVLRCEKLKGLSKEGLDRVLERIRLTSGAAEFVQQLKRMGCKTAIISGGFDFAVEKIRRELDIDFAFSNTLQLKDGLVSGEVQRPLLNPRAKADILESLAAREGIALDEILAVGDGANDALMLEKAGFGVAFNAKKILRERADFALNQKDLRWILYLMGLTADEIGTDFT